MLSKISLAFRYPEEMFSKRRGNLACHWTNDLKFIYLWSSQKSQNSWQNLHHFRFLYLHILTLLQPHFVSALLPFICMHHWNQRDRKSRGVNGPKKINTHFLMGGDNASFSVISIRKICFNTGIEYKMFTWRKCFKRARKNATGTTNRT